MRANWQVFGIRTRVVAALALMLALSGCASAKTTTYALSPVPPARTAAHALSLPIEVGEVSIPPSIDRNAIVLRAPGDRLEVAGTSVWGAPIQELIRAALSDDLTARLAPGSVLPPGAPSPSGGLRIVTVIIREFGGDVSGRVVLDAAWATARSGTEPRAPLEETRIVRQAADGTAAAVVPVMSQALGVLADRIAATLH